MPTVQGGMLDHLVWESFHRWLHGHLTTLNWFEPLNQLTAPDDPERPPITWSTDDQVDRERVALNTLMVSQADTESTLLETGSNLTEDITPIWVEFYATDDQLGRMVTGDIRTICQGKYAGLVEEPCFTVYDWRDDPETELFTAHLQNVERLHGGQNPASPEMRHWWGVYVEVAEERA